MSRLGRYRWAGLWGLAALLVGLSGTSPLFAQGGWTDEQLAASAEMAAAIDRHLADRWKAEGVEPAPLVSNRAFLRRASLDLTGAIPTVREVREQLEADELLSGGNVARGELVDRLLASPAAPTHLARTWSRMIFPTAGADFVQRQSQQGLLTWLRRQFAENTRYDRMVEQFVVAKDSGQGPGVFYQTNTEPERLAAETARIFLGVQLQCAECHDHPFDQWKQREFWEFTAFFAQLERRDTNNQGQMAIEIIDRTYGEVRYPDSEEVAEPAFPVGYREATSLGGTRREQLAIWMVSRDNPFLARRAVNWAWAHLMGRGLVHPVDDISEKNRPSHPELMDELTEFFVQSGFDLKLLLRTIAISEAYARASNAAISDERPELFAAMASKILTPDQLYDSLRRVGLQPSDSLIIPESRRSFVTSLQAPGSDPTRFELGAPQALALMNGPLISQLSNPDQSRLLQAAQAPFWDPADQVELLFLSTLAKPPEPAERELLISMLAEAPAEEQPRLMGDILWSILNSAEFMLND